MSASYAVSAGRIYYCNGVVNGSVVNGVYRSWGVADRMPSLVRVIVSTAGVAVVLDHITIVATRK